MRPYSRAREKLTGAIVRLATHEGDVRTRLRSAHFFLRQLTERELPPELLAQWSSIMHRLTRRGPELAHDGEVLQDAVAHTMAKIRNSTGRVIATDVYRLYKSFIDKHGV